MPTQEKTVPGRRHGPHLSSFLRAHGAHEHKRRCPHHRAISFQQFLRRILKDYQPDYVGIVFDTSKPTFRDKLFEEYKAHRPKMPDELSIQLPFVRRLCEAMRMPILELDGYEADDVLGALSRQATQENLDVVLVTNDKDMLQLVGDGVRVLRTGTGAAKSDILVDEKKVEEILGVPPDKVVDVMALMGDSIDNIPGARDPNDKPAPGERRKPGIGRSARAKSFCNSAPRKKPYAAPRK